MIICLIKNAFISRLCLICSIGGTLAQCSVYDCIMVDCRSKNYNNNALRPYRNMSNKRVVTSPASIKFLLIFINHSE